MNTKHMHALIAALMIFCTADVLAMDKTDETIEQIKQNAVDQCIAGAEAKYGLAKVVSKPRKKKIGSNKGYAVKMKVGDNQKKVMCLAGRDGETKFYTGNI